MRKVFWIGFIVVLCAVWTCAVAEEVRIGVCVYNASIRSAIERSAQPDTTLLISEDVRDQNQQVQKIQELLDQQADVLIVNLIDRTAAVYIIRMAMRAHLPIIFVNSEPLPEDMQLYDAAYYVGSNAQLTGWMCGQIAVAYFRENVQADRNQDGILQLVLLKGQTGHQDAEFRTKYSLKALRDAGFTVEVLSQEVAMWEREQAQTKMAACLATFGDRIECVISNNDEMALGAIEALKAAGYFEDGRIMPVVGVDGVSSSSAAAIRDGTLLGTVLNNTSAQGSTAYALARALALGEPLIAEHLGYPLEGDHYVWIPCEIIQ